MAEKTQEPEEVPWNLFISIALRDEVKDNHILLENKAREIYEQYSCVPGLLKNIAVLLSYKHTVKEWEYLQDTVLKNPHSLSETKSPYPDLSTYEQLPSNLKQCLRYCSLFPKNYELTKTELLHLWGSEDLVDDEPFQKLQENRYFDLREGTEDLVEMHALVRAFTEEIGKPEFCLVDETNMREIDYSEALHISFRVNSSSEAPTWVIHNTNLQSLLFLPRKPYDYATNLKINEILASATCLRALDLVGVNCENLVNPIGELKHLRYLRLGISFEKPPESITRLVNLHTLDLRQSGVIVLPKDFHNLTNLRHLYTGGRLMDMPPNFGRLKSLQKLDEFVVGKNNGVDALAELKDLVAKLIIRYQTKPPPRQEKVELGKNLTHISLTWSSFYEHVIATNDEDHSLKLPASLESLSVYEWKGERFPYSLTDQIYLVSLCIEDSNCTYLPDLKKLPHLKCLQLRNLKALEYIESYYDQHLSAVYSVSLQYVMLADLPELKGWSSNLEYLMTGLTPHLSAKVKSVGWSATNYGLFHCLELKLTACPKLKWKLEVPKLVSLKAHNISKELLREILQKTRSLSNLEVVSVMELGTLDLKDQLSLQDLTLRQCTLLQTFAAAKGLNCLQIHDCHDFSFDLSTIPSISSIEVKNSRLVGLRFPKLHSLKFINVQTLQKNYYGRRLQRVKPLEQLSFCAIYDLRSLPDWLVELTQVKRLTVKNCPFLATLPEALSNMYALEELEIESCPLLRKFPNSFIDLKSLKQVKIRKCPKLYKRCMHMGGEDFHLIQHVPCVVLEE